MAEESIFAKKPKAEAPTSVLDQPKPAKAKKTASVLDQPAPAAPAKAAAPAPEKSGSGKAGLIVTIVILASALIAAGIVLAIVLIKQNNIPRQRR